MSTSVDSLPTNLDLLRSLVQQLTGERDAAVAECQRLSEQNERLWEVLKQAQDAQYGRRSEQLDRDQMELALEERETAEAQNDALENKRNGTTESMGRPKRRANRGYLPAHLPRVHVTLAPEQTVCSCCQGKLHQIGEDISQRLDVVPAQHQVIVTHRPKYGCRACESAVVQAKAPDYLIKQGLPTERLVASIIVAKFAWHLPLYRQARMMALQGLPIDRQTLAHWVGYGAAEIRPIYLRLKELLLMSAKLVVDETRAPVLEPGRGRTKSGYLWAISRDDRPWGGTSPPAVAYTYAPGRHADYAVQLLKDYVGTVQCDGYAAYKRLADPRRKPAPIVLAFCWAHWRRLFVKIARQGNAPIADEALVRIAEIYAIEQSIRGRSAEERREVRQAQSKPRVEDLKPWLEAKLRTVSIKSKIADAIRYGLKHWDGLTRFLEDGRIELDTNSVERAMRPIALTRKNSLFAGHDGAAEDWACLASLIETAKLHNLDPQAYIADILTKCVNGWPMAKIDELLPWAWSESASHKIAA